jgi:GxxExxY protein
LIPARPSEQPGAGSRVLTAEDVATKGTESTEMEDEREIAQVLGYLRASGRRHGLLINFGAPKLEIRKLIL